MTEKPAPSVLWSWVVLLLMIAVLLTAAGVYLAVYLPAPWRLPLAILWGGGLALIFILYLPLRRRNMCYHLGDTYIEVTSGVLWITTRRIHREAVRQVTLLQGPVERYFDTAFVLVSATGGYLLIEGIDPTQAADWCRRLYPQ